MDFINTSNPDFIGGRKALEIASEHVTSSRIVTPAAKHQVGALCFEFLTKYVFIDYQGASFFDLIVN